MEAGKSSVPECNRAVEVEHNDVRSLSDVESGDEETSGVSRGSNHELMPLNSVSRIMRNALPTGAKVSGEAKQAIQLCLSKYISFITSEAKDRCGQEMRRIISAEDIIGAHANLGFESYVDPLNLYLQRYRQFEATRNAARARRSASYPPVGVVQQSPPPLPTPPPSMHRFPSQPTTQFAPLEGCYNDPTFVNMDPYYSFSPGPESISDILFDPLYPQLPGDSTLLGGDLSGSQATSAGGEGQVTGGSSAAAPHDAVLGLGDSDAAAPSSSRGSGHRSLLR